MKIYCGFTIFLTVLVINRLKYLYVKESRIANIVLTKMKYQILRSVVEDIIHHKKIDKNRNEPYYSRFHISKINKISTFESGDPFLSYAP